MLGVSFGLLCGGATRSDMSLCPLIRRNFALGDEHSGGGPSAGPRGVGPALDVALGRNGAASHRLARARA